MLIDSYEKLRDAQNGKLPRVARFRISATRDYLTPFKDSGDKVYKDRFIIVGTAYGYLHSAEGGVRMWRSYSGAYKFLKANFSPVGA